MGNNTLFRGLIFSALLMIMAVGQTARSEGAETFPAPHGAVNDFAGVIPSSYQGQMENVAREVLEKTGTAIVVATVETIGDNDPNDYANRLYRAWGIGKKGKDKGVLIFLAVKERRVRIETGYGVEGILPDGLVGEILDRYAIPYLKEGDYGRGLSETMTAVSNVVAKDAGVTLTGARPPEQPPVRTERKMGIVQVLLLIVAAFLLLGTRQGRAMLPWLLVLMMSGGSDRRGGGGFGGFGGGGFGGFGGGASGGGGASRGF
ncbi:MAG: TPM domain-containing protein [Syntrophales bacterium]